MDKSFGLKISVLKHLSLAYIHTKTELKTHSHWAVKHRFVLKLHVKTMLNCRNKPEFTSFYVYHGDTIDGHLKMTNHKVVLRSCSVEHDLNKRWFFKTILHCNSSKILLNYNKF